MSETHDTPAAAIPSQRSRRLRVSLFANNEPMIWLTGGTLALALLMILGLLALVLWFGLSTFWAVPIVHVTTSDGRVYMGEVARVETYVPGPEQLAALPPELGDAAAAEVAATGSTGRRLIRTGNFQITQNHFCWVDEFAIDQATEPEWAILVEQLEWGRFYGLAHGFAFLHPLETTDSVGAPRSVEEIRTQARALLAALVPEHGGELQLLVVADVGGREGQQLVPATELDGSQPLAVAEVVSGAERTWHLFQDNLDETIARRERRRRIEKHDAGEISTRVDRVRLELRAASLAREQALATQGPSSPAATAAARVLEEANARFLAAQAESERDFAAIRREIVRLDRENDRCQLILETAGEGTTPPVQMLLPLAVIVRAYPANQLTLAGKLGIFVARWWEFLTAEPREANSEGGVFPAIFGTVAMTLLLSLLVVPLGVLAALYLREYARAGLMVSAVRIAVNNLAGVPSIVFGVFGLGFFCYVVGASIDQLLFSSALPNPTFGTGGLLWASLTLALMTLPVVIVATEEALAAVPNSMRLGSYACGASKWQTIRRIVLPRALPGIMTGMILAMARGAGEVAPLMLVGAVKLAPELPIDGIFPYVHPERSFMHLGFHIYDVGFQSQNSEAAKPMVYTTTLLLIVIVTLLNLTAVWLRSRLRRRFSESKF